MAEPEENKIKQASGVASEVVDVTMPSIKLVAGQEEQNPANSSAQSRPTEDSGNLAARVPKADKSEKGSELVGKVIGSKYQVLEFIGSGGMSSVYLAKHLHLNKTLALKMIHPHLASDKESLARFQREAEATSRLDHPNLVKVHDFGISEDGSPYIIMDYIEGSTLSKAISSKQLDTDRVVHIISQACSALEHAHGRSVVHRDIKPSNIMLVNNGTDPDFVKVVDFGIAQLVVEDAEVARLTQTGQIFGTPMYMSPEQCQGQRLDARTDIYSLACVMYEALAGKTPFEGNSVYELIFKQINEAPAGLGSNVADKQKREALETIIFRALAKDPSDRYQTMATLKDDLDNLNQATDTGIVGSINRFVRQWYFRQLTRNLRPMLARIPILVIAILGLAGLISMVIVPQLQLAQPSIELWKKLDKEGQQLFDHGKKPEALATFNRSLEVAKKLEDKKLIVASLEELIDINRAIGDQAQVSKVKEELKTYRETVKQAQHLQEDIAQEAQKLKGKVTDPADAERLRTLCNSAIDATMALTFEGDLDYPLNMLKQIKEFVERAFGTNDPLMVRCVHNMANIAHNQARYEDAIAGYKDTLSLEEKVLSPFDATNAKTLKSLARVYMQTGTELNESEKLLKKAIEITRKAYGPESSQLANCRYLLATLYKSEGRRAEARREIETAIAIYEHSNDEQDKLWLAECYDILGRITNDPQYTEKSLSKFEDTLGKEPQTMCQLLIRMADNTVEKDATAAQAYLDRARAISERFNKADKDRIEVELKPSQSRIYQKQGKMDQAEKELRDAMQYQEKEKGKDSLQVLDMKCQLADLLRLTPKTQEAEELYKQIFTALEAKKANRAYVGNGPFFGYARLLNAQNRKDEAQQLAERWKKID